MTGNSTELGSNDYDEKMTLMPNLEGESCSWNVIIDIQHQQKFSSRYTMQNGFNHVHLDFDTWMNHVLEIGGPLYRVYETNGITGLTRFYTNHKIALTKRLSTVAGANVMWQQSIHKAAWNEQWLCLLYQVHNQQGTRLTSVHH